MVSNILRVRRIFHWGTKTEGRQRGRGSWGGGSNHLPTSYGVWGSAVSSPSGVRGGEPRPHKGFSTILITQGDLCWHCNVVNCGLRCSHWRARPSVLRTPPVYASDQPL